MRYTFMSETAPPGSAKASPDAPAWAGDLEQRLLDRVDEHLSAELDERVIRIVEDKLRDETERRMWRHGFGVL